MGSGYNAVTYFHNSTACIVHRADKHRTSTQLPIYCSSWRKNIAKIVNKDNVSSNISKVTSLKDVLFWNDLCSEVFSVWNQFCVANYCDCCDGIEGKRVNCTEYTGVLHEAISRLGRQPFPYSSTIDPRHHHHHCQHYHHVHFLWIINVVTSYRYDTRAMLKKHYSLILVK